MIIYLCHPSYALVKYGYMYTLTLTVSVTLFVHHDVILIHYK